MAERGNMNRREFMRLAGLGTAGALLTACGAAPTPETVVETVIVEKEVESVVTATPGAAPKKITWLEMWSSAWASFGPQADKWEQDFIAMHPEENLVIERRIFGADANWENVVLNAVNAGNLEDLALTNPWMVPSMVDKVPLAPVDDLREAVGGEEQFTFGHPWQGHEYLMLMYGSPTIPWVNRTMLEESGVDEYPETWDEHIAAGQKVTDTAKQQYWNTLMLCGGSGGHLGYAFFFPWLAQTGKPGVDDENHLIFNNEGGVQVLEFWKEMEDAGILTPGSISNCGNFGLQTFGSGNTAWVGHEGPWMVPHFKAQDVAFEVSGNVVSEGPGGNLASALGTGLATNANAKHLDWAKEFLGYLTTGEASYELCMEQSMITPYKPMIERVAREIPMAEPLLEQGEIGAIGMPIFASWYDFLTILSQRIGEFWIGEKSAKQALDEAVSDWEQVIQRA